MVTFSDLLTIITNIVSDSVTGLGTAITAIEGSDWLMFMFYITFVGLFIGLFARILRTIRG